MCSRCPFQVLNAPLLFPKDDTDPPPRSWDAYWPRLCRRPTPPPQPPAPFVARLLPEPGIESSQMPPPFGSNLLCSPRTSHSEYRPDDIKMVWRTCADSVDSGWKFGQALLASRASRNPGKAFAPDPLETRWERSDRPTSPRPDHPASAIPHLQTHPRPGRGWRSKSSFRPGQRCGERDAGSAGR